MSKGKIRETKRRTRDHARKMQQIHKKTHAAQSTHGSRMSRVFDSTHNLLVYRKFTKATYFVHISYV